MVSSVKSRQGGVSATAQVSLASRAPTPALSRHKRVNVTIEP